MSRTSNIESDNSQNGGLEDYNYISDGFFPHFTTPSIKDKLRVEQICRFFQIIQIIMFFQSNLNRPSFQSNPPAKAKRQLLKYSIKTTTTLYTVVESNFQKKGPKKIGPKII